MFVYGAVAVAFSLMWSFSQEKQVGKNEQVPEMTHFLDAIGHVIRLRNVWILCIGTAGVSGCVNGMLGFLPLYLRGLGWAPALADGTLASFHAASMLFAIPIALLSDRMGNRRAVLMTAALLVGTGTGLLGFARGALIWAAVLIAGFARDGFMAITMTAIMETEGVGARYAGSATGLTISVLGITNVFSPPVGNWLTRFGSATPFLFWAALAFMGFLAYFFFKRERGPKQTDLVRFEENLL